jgi:hypothetical protein
MTPGQHFSKPSHLAFHNLCRHSQPPPGTEYLLGMGLKCCLETPCPRQQLSEGLRRFHQSVHLHFSFKNQESDSDSEDSTDDNRNVTYIPSLYIPSDWHPPLLIMMQNGHFTTSINVYTQSKQTCPDSEDTI